MLLEGYASLLTRVEFDIPHMEVSIGTGCRLSARERVGELDVVTITGDGGPIRFALELPLGDAEGYWYPNAGHFRTLPPDWRGSDKTSIISSSPLGCLYDRVGRSILAFGFSEQIEESVLRFGISEEHKSFVVYYEHDPKGPGTVRLALAPPGLDHGETIGLIRDWLREDVGAALPVPHVGTVPVYSTWYTYSQAVDAEKVMREAALSRELECRAVIIDDGWQKFGSGRWYAGCGDWIPDTDKFPDLWAHVAGLRGLGLSVMLWVAPLMLGPNSAAAARLKPYAPHYSEGLKASVLDPRHRQSREHFVETCVRLVRDYGIDGLKIDFLDSAVVYQGTETTGDIKDVGQAIHATLVQLKEGLRLAGLSEVLIEFRQSYIGPATAPYGNLLRAGDCPGDAILNRRSIVDTRMIAAGQVVHADPVLWDPRAGAEPAARQLLNAYFGVPQLSMELSSLPEEQRRAVRAVLSSWMRTRETVLFGALSAGLPSENYPVIQARHQNKLVVGVYQPMVVEIDLTGIDGVTVLNATAEATVVVRWTGGARRVDGEARSVTGDLAGRFLIEAKPGLSELAIPVSGIATLDVKEG